MSSFYRRIDDHRYEAQSECAGPWSVENQHGSPPMALLTALLESHGGDDGRIIAKIAFEIHAPIPLGAFDVEISVVRPGRKIELLSASLSKSGRTYLSALCWRLLAVEGRSPQTRHPSIPRLDTGSATSGIPSARGVPYLDSLDWIFVDGSFGEIGSATAWTRPRIPLLEDSTDSPLVRCALMIDSANGISNVLPFGGWSFVPVDLMASFERAPMGEWLGMSCETTLGDAGIGYVTTRLFDASGYFGAGLHTLWVEPKA